jgi:putative Holliday junction resolvase
MGLDIGEKRIGVALSDVAGTVASPLTVLDAARVRGDSKELLRLIDDYEVETVVVGLPLSLDGTEGPQARHVRTAANRLAEVIPVPLVYYDERYSSVEAKQSLTRDGVSSRQQRGAVDSVAAAVFLQDYLDEQVGQAGGRTDR